MYMVRADKSRNMYKIEPSKYQEILNNKITDNYKIDNDNTIDQINKDTCNFASKLHINDRLWKFQKKDAHILFKGHKPNFISKLQTRLINPSKTVLGKISKKYDSRYCYECGERPAIVIFGETLLIPLNGLGR